MTAYVVITHTAYPLTPGRGYGTEVVVEVYDEPGYAVDLLATINASHPEADLIAGALARAWSPLPAGEVQVKRRYKVREHRSAVSRMRVDEHGTEQWLSPVHGVTAEEYQAIIYGRDPGPAARSGGSDD